MVVLTCPESLDNCFLLEGEPEVLKLADIKNNTNFITRTRKMVPRRAVLEVNRRHSYISVINCGLGKIVCPINTRVGDLLVERLKVLVIGSPVKGLRLTKEALT